MAARRGPRHSSPSSSSTPKPPPAAPAGQANARLLAWKVLRRWKPDGAYAEDLVDQSAIRHSLSAPNRGLLNALVMAVLRHRSLLDAWIDHLRGGGALDPETREWLRLGLAQCLLLELPEHAAVHETVELAGRARNLVNAILRRALREREALEKVKREAPPHVRHSLPEFLAAKWRRQFGADGLEKLGEWCNAPAPIFVRANGLAPKAAEKLAALPTLTPSEEHEGFFLCEELPRRELTAGLCYAQDPSTAAAPRALAPKPGEDVLDACAAPGGKTCLLAELMENSGRLVATDAAPARLERLRSNLSRMNVAIAEVFVHDWEKEPPPASWRQRFPEGFHRILLDVPCSNTGVLRRRVDARWRLRPEFLTEIAERQRTLLRNLLPLLRPGGRLVYSTCSIEPEENAELVRQTLADMPGWRQLHAVKLLPHVNGTDGAFASLIERIA